MENLIGVEAVAATEAGAIAAARLMGRGDRNGADRAAVEAMRRAMEDSEISGTIVIGEGERDLRKLIVGPMVAGHVSINDPVEQTIATIADRLGRNVWDITVVILDRPRHEQLISEVRASGARIKLISDGDLTAGISVAVSGTGVHAVMGIGGAPEGVLTAAALKCLGGEIQATFAWRSDEEKERARGMGLDVDDQGRVYTTNELASGENVVFSATGVTDGELLRGVRFFGGGARTHSLLMAYKRGTVRFIDTVHTFDDRRPPRVRL